MPEIVQCLAVYKAPNGYAFNCLLSPEHAGQHEHMVDGSGVKWDQIRLSTVDHPAHYGGADNPHEAIKVIEAWSLGFCLGNCLKYICRAGKKNNALTSDLIKHATIEDLRKAAWYLNREIERLSSTTDTSR